jgi:hypothetical protein
LQVVFTGSRKSGKVDLEAVEMLVRDSMHHAGTAALERLLSMSSPQPEQSACSCGHVAHNHGKRTKQILTAVGRVRFERSYYVCPHCHRGHSPRDRELDVEGVTCSPGVRRMMAVVGSESSFDQGREQLALLAGIEVTAKAVERQAETIGAAIEAGEQVAIRRAKQLELPEVGSPGVPVFYVEMDGTEIPVVKAETEGRAGKVEGESAHTREVKLGCVFTQTAADPEGRPVRDERSTSYVAAIETAEAFRLRLYTEAWRRCPTNQELAKAVVNEMARAKRRVAHPLGVPALVIEAGCKTVIGSRLKCSGMFWTVRGANAIIALRCCRLSHKFEDYWATRAA